jgi:hypothetical protein
VQEPELIDEHMNVKSQENLKTICFEGQLLPNWAQLLFLAARLCPVSEDVSLWFSRLTSCSGVDDARTVREQCGLLRASIQEYGESILAELERSRGDDDQSKLILAAWMYALDTMIQEAQSKKTCSWIVETAEEASLNDLSEGDTTFSCA